MGMRIYRDSCLHIKNIKPNSDSEETNEIKQIGYALDNTKIAIFEINKGSNKYPDIDVNAKIKYEDEESLLKT